MTTKSKPKTKEPHDKELNNVDPETILMTLEQVSQTINVLSNVVGRLQNHMQDYLSDQELLKHERIHQGELLLKGGKYYH